jgi:hypothetical protein
MGEGTKLIQMLHRTSHMMVGNTCTTNTNMEYCYLIFRGNIRWKILSANLDILTFKPWFNPISHIHRCEKEWRKGGYLDERVWPHIFQNTLDDIPYKWYKIEEVCGHTFNWNEIKENFIKDFEFRPEEALLQEATREINFFWNNQVPTKFKRKEKLKSTRNRI